MGLEEMIQIRMDEMSDRRKVQYAQMKKKKDSKIIKWSMYINLAMFLVVLVTVACLVPEDFNELPLLSFIGAVAIAIVLWGNKKHLKIMEVYDAVMEERVWEGYIENLCFGEVYEFVDKNNQTLQKRFAGEEYKPYADAGKVHVLYIARLDRWYMEKGEQS